ncbi:MULTISPECIES: 50S ribosomal protein L11 [unclassified Paenibacillus]|uniref:50S ribosomal protein L11 n=1 Tax=unclassified Paenibacillus TaxID=185978 RepID=UPI001C10DADE|nr:MULTISPECIES: 50S ribosomal protein L11 [unclassified Paenibacillus]MBU5445562.1 50S ribosomal protein L11 [Paenibacillus sp. MSJ-34]CAH0120242.1 50S ribosomal protein L11 [Paenibacillus sp. CECT 9249]
MKAVKRIVKLDLEAGKANPAKVGKDLAPAGINLLGFCNQYNEMTKSQTGFVIPAEITVYEDRSFDIKLKTPPAAFLLKKYAGVARGAAKPGSETVGSITRDELRKIAEIKLPDLNTVDIESAMKTIAGTAKNMGIRIEET